METVTDIRHDSHGVYGLTKSGKVLYFPYIKEGESMQVSEYGIKTIPVSGRTGVIGFEVQYSGMDYSDRWKQMQPWMTDDKNDLIRQINT